MTKKILSPVTLGDLELKNRVIMAPMTRSRANPDGTANKRMARYYSQRANAGLIISEGVFPSEDGKGYCRTPGIANAEQQQSWQAVTQAVHAQGGKIVMQLMHCGRIAHRDNKAAGSRTVAPSAIQAQGQMYTDTQGMQNFDTPHALTTAEVAAVINDYKLATERALSAGFDGVELHCTSGYLPAQFLSSATNLRNDAYGGNVNGRIRFVVECLQALISVAGHGRVGLRICPANPFNDLHDDNPAETFTALLQALAPMKLAYLHAIKSPAAEIDVIAMSQQYFNGPLIINDGFDQHSAENIIASGAADAVSFGRHFIANADLPACFRDDITPRPFDPKTLYTAGEAGYSDYPSS